MRADFKVKPGDIERLWEDLRFPATAINPPGAVNDPNFDTTNGGWLFDAAATEVLFIIAQLPHSWREGTGIRPHVHWQKTTSASGAVLWRFEYKWSPAAATMDANFTAVDASTVVDGTPDTNTANRHLITSFGTLDANNRLISDILLIKLSRVGGNAADTYGADARLLEFDIHYQRDAPGSEAEFAKQG